MYSVCCSAQTAHKLHQQSRKQALRAYCPNVYTVLHTSRWNVLTQNTHDIVLDLLFSSSFLPATIFVKYDTVHSPSWEEGKLRPGWIFFFFRLCTTTDCTTSQIVGVQLCHQSLEEGIKNFYFYYKFKWVRADFLLVNVPQFPWPMSWYYWSYDYILNFFRLIFQCETKVTLGILCSSRYFKHII